jgi:general secretion pathway protein D
MFLPLLLLLFFSVNITFAQQSPGKAGKVQTGRFVTIDFNNVDIVVFIKFISELTGRNFIIDQRVKGKVTIISPAKISIEEAYKVFESVLEVHGYATVQAGEVIKIIPSPDARTKNVELMLREAAQSPEDKVVTQLIPLNYADPNEIRKLFAPLVSKSSVILSYPPTNTLIITDVQSNIQRLLRILDEIDVAGIGQELSLISLDYADAKKMVAILESIFRTKRKPKKGEPKTEIRFVADERTNAIVLMASEYDSYRIKQFVAMLDQQTPRGTEKIRVRYLEYANADELSKVLQDLPTKKTSGKQVKKAPVVSGDVRISADKATNSLIIVAEKEDYTVLEDIIDKLDIPRSMVYIESLIMEVLVDKGFEVGVRWRALGGTSINDESGAVGGAFSGGADAIDEKTIAEPGSGGFAMGIISGAIEIMTAGGTPITVPNLSAVATAFESDRDVHILSTPQILTTDNEEARIVVGKNVPFQTRSSQISGTVDTFSSFEYRDVGLTLKITPQINKDRLVRLNISQELTALTGNPEDSDFKPTTLKRSIDTTVIVKNGSTVVIGGLIDETFTQRDAGVPCLGSIPGLRWLFSTRTRASQRSNLFVFLTPRVITNQKEAKSVYTDKKKQIDEVREGRIKMYEKKFWAPDEGIPVPPNPKLQ